jgi:16S rRNA (cytidine1402-2'-O)-methyltransferase
MDQSGSATSADGTIPERFRALPRTLYVVATPLGNLRDVTLRALDVLGSADIIAAEDTRVTSVLLRHYGIATRTLSLHQHNEAVQSEKIVELLAAGRSVALVSDAGTPGISDPGARVVRAARSHGLPVVPIPGASSAIAAVSATGLTSQRFLFLGFMPHAAKARRALLESVATVDAALVVFEAPHRVAEAIVDLAMTLGGERSLTIAREITKKFETIATMTVAQAPAWLASDPHRERGEIVLLVDAPTTTATHAPTTVDVRRLMAALIAELPPARAARIAAVATGLSRDVCYEEALALKKREG